MLEAERKLLIRGEEANVGGRAFDLLVTLIRHRDRILHKNELFDLVWRDTIVEENNLRVQINSLRKLLGPQAVATIPGRGYRFTLPLELVEAEGRIEKEEPGVAHAAPASAAPAASMVPPASGIQRATHGRLTNIADRLPYLFGRSSDIALVRALLERHRVVSIVAAAGVGKTRLAQAVAGELREVFPDGIWCVELAVLESGAERNQIACEIARVIGLQLAAGRPAHETVIDDLRTQSLLLLLDNCEHLIASVAPLVDAIVGAAPGVHVLVTSQEPLKIAEEQVVRLDPLALPSTHGLESARDSAAIQMLVSRIQSGVPKFALTAANADVLAGICRRLDGIPLALELAAARVSLLGIEGLHARLDERFRVLTAGSRSAPLRHQTLRAAMDFSHGLLMADEQAVFRRLAVFAGSFSVENAQDVACDEAIDRWAVLDHLGALVDKSIVLAEGGDDPRLRLLETGRAYALERLDAAGETAAWRERHAHVVAKWFADVHDESWTLSDAAMHARYAPEVDNLHAALGWALHHDAELAIALVGDACPLWRDAMLLQPVGARYCEAALALVKPTTPRRRHGRVLYAYAWMNHWSRPPAAGAAAAQAADLLRGTESAAVRGMNLLLLLAATPNAQQAPGLAELQSLHDPQAPPRVRVQLLSALGFWHMGAGRFNDAMRLYDEARTLLAGCGATQWEALLHWRTGVIAVLTADLDFAVTTLEETTRKLELLPIRGAFLGVALGSLSTAHLLRGDVAAARASMEKAVPVIVRYDMGWLYAATAALLAASECRWAAAGHLLGFRESSATPASQSQTPSEAIACRRATEALSANASEHDIASWKDAGARLSTEAAYRLALG